MPEAVSALLLDLDDTLIDTRRGTHLALRDFHGTHGTLMGVGREEAEARWNRGIERYFPRYIRGELSFQDQRRGRIREMFGNPAMNDAEADRLFGIYLDHYKNHYILFADVAACLDRLASFPMAIVTNGAVEHQTLKLRVTGLDQKVKTIVISEAIGLRKPQKEIFLHAARELGVDPAGCLMVGDNREADCQGALAAGMRTLWMDRFGEAGEAQGIPRVRGMAEVLQALSGPFPS